MKNVVLIGFMGTGKTSTGKVLAAKLGAAFIDMDQKIEEEGGIKYAKRKRDNDGKPARQHREPQMAEGTER